LFNFRKLLQQKDDDGVLVNQGKQARLFFPWTKYVLFILYKIGMGPFHVLEQQPQNQIPGIYAGLKWYRLGWDLQVGCHLVFWDFNGTC